MSSITALPPELLLEIYSYLSPYELLDNVQDVCTAWKMLVRHPPLWKDFVYSNKNCSSYEEAITFIQKCPMLRHIHLHIKASAEAVLGPQEFISTVIRTCLDVRTFRVEFGSELLTVSQIDALFKAFPSLECFTIKINSQNATRTIERISKCNKLKKLIVKSEEYSDGWLIPVADGCKSLEYLCFVWSEITDTDYLYLLENMKDRLMNMKFSIYQPTTQQVVNTLSSFTKLENLNLHHRTLDFVNFLPLTNIRTLRFFSFTSDTYEINHVGTIFDALFSNPFPLLEKLGISIYSSDWNRRVVEDICRCYLGLKCLSLWYSPLDSIGDTFKGICSLKNLESLICRNNSSITDDDVEFIAKCPRLKHLGLEGCIGLTDKTVGHLANCKSLESLNLCCCQISGCNLHLITENLTNLKCLKMYGTNTDPKHLYILSRKMPLVDVHF